MLERSTHIPWLAIILGGALLVRLAAAVAVQHMVDQTPGRLCLIDGDADGYWRLAHRIVRGEDYVVYGRHVLRMPGFPLLLAAGIRLFGESLLAIRLLLAVVGTAGCYLVYWLGCVLFDRNVALRACLCSALLPSFVVFSVLLLSETLFAVLVVASLIPLALLVKSDAPPLAARYVPTIAGSSLWSGGYLALLAGALIGLATLVRPTWLLVGPGFVALYLLAARNRWRAAIHGVLLLFALGLTMLPWTVRNALVTGHFVPTTLWVGPSLYDGLNPDATGASDMRFEEHDRIYERMSEYDADHYYREAAKQFAREHPLRAVKLSLIKLWRYWNPFPNASQFGHWAIAGTVGLCNLLLLGLAARGAWRVRRSLWAWLIPAAPVLYFAAVHAVFVGSLRYRLPVEYPLTLLAACGTLGSVAGGKRVAGSKPEEPCP